MHIDQEHSHAHTHTDPVTGETYTHTHEHGAEHNESHAHEHTHVDAETGKTYAHTHAHTHEGEHHHHHHDHEHEHEHCPDHECAHCQTPCEHTPMEELTALMKYMVGHNAAHARELADLAKQLEQAGSHTAYEQVMAAVSDFEKGNLRLSAVLASLDVK